MKRKLDGNARYAQLDRLLTKIKMDVKNAQKDHILILYTINANHVQEVRSKHPMDIAVSPLVALIQDNSLIWKIVSANFALWVPSIHTVMKITIMNVFLAKAFSQDQYQNS